MSERDLGQQANQPPGGDSRAARARLLDDSGALPALDPSSGLKRSHRFQTRLLGYLLALSCTSSIIAGAIYYSRQVKFVEAEQATRGQTLISNLAGQSELGAYSGDPAFLTAPVRRAFLERDVSFAAIYGFKGELLLQMVKPDVRVDLRLPRHVLAQLKSDATGTPIRKAHPDYDDLFAPIFSVQGDAEESLFGTTAGRGTATIGVARLGLSHHPAQRKLDEVLRWGIYLALIVLAMGALMAIGLSRRISQPILALTRGADEIRRGNLGFELHLKRSDELGLLAESFNRMSAKLHQTVESLAHLNRNLEQEVADRTMALRRSRDFIALLNSPPQLNKLLDTALDALVRYTGALAGAILLREANGALQLLVSQGALAGAFRQGPEQSTQFMLDAVATRRTQVVTSLPADYALARECPGVKTVLCVPSEFRDQVEALLILGLDRPPAKDMVDFVEHASSQLGIAISNARAYASTERLAYELEHRNVALLQQRDQLQEVSRLKSEFLANISHELRTPLNAILGYAELLADGIYGGVTPEQVQSLAGITESATNLHTLINQILDLSKVEAGRMTILLEEVDLRALVHDVVSFSAPLVKDRPYTVTAELAAGPLRVRTDRGKVRQILINLVSNAIKFTAQGSVRIAAAADERGDVQVSVEDTGIGIRTAHLDLIFDEFRQVDGSSTRKHGGTGLGLAISKKFATLLGGDIRVQSVWGKGSRFTLLLPRAAVGAASAEQAKPELSVIIGESNVSRS